MAAKFCDLFELDCPFLAKPILRMGSFVQIPYKTVVAPQYFKHKSN